MGLGAGGGRGTSQFPVEEGSDRRECWKTEGFQRPLSHEGYIFASKRLAEIHIFTLYIVVKKSGPVPAEMAGTGMLALGRERVLSNSGKHIAAPNFIEV